MTTTPPTPARMSRSSRLRPARLRSARAGFSFVEVLFAVMILGIGFIMIAGVFPAAISQTAATQEETIAPQIARGAVTVLSELPYKDLLVPVNTLNPREESVERFDEENVLVLPELYEVFPKNPNNIKPWELIKHAQILPENPRFAWIPMIHRLPVNRDGEAPREARVIVVSVQVRQRDQFTENDLKQYDNGVNRAYGTLMPLLVKVNVTEGGNDVDVLRFDQDGQTSQNNRAAAPGAVVVIRKGDDKENRSAVGRVYRLGNPLANETDAYELLPGNDMYVDPGPNGRIENPPGSGDDKSENTGNTRNEYHEAYLIGQGLADPSRAVREYAGGSMVIGVYSGYIRVR